MWFGCVARIEEVDRQVKVLIKNLAIFFLCPNKQFLLIPFHIQLLEYFPQKTEGTKTKAARVLITDKVVTTKILSYYFAHLATLKSSNS
jgi:putative effector of murein hydrolase LrgA (UPF0299 family)